MVQYRRSRVPGGTFFFTVALRDRRERTLTEHTGVLIHFNPVKHGWVHRVRDWPHSTFHRYVRQGLCPADWAGADVEAESGQYGE